MRSTEFGLERVFSVSRLREIRSVQKKKIWLHKWNNTNILHSC